MARTHDAQAVASALASLAVVRVLLNPPLSLTKRERLALLKVVDSLAYRLPLPEGTRLRHAARAAVNLPPELLTHARLDGIMLLLDHLRDEVEADLERLHHSIQRSADAPTAADDPFSPDAIPF